MLNWAARYFPILRTLKNTVGVQDTILEVGSGSFGLANYLPGRVVGCDVKFSVQPLFNLLPVRASAGLLPFADGSFAAVVSSDVLEHVPPSDRPQVIRETLRVARKLAIFGFPCGPLAQKLDASFLDFYRVHSLRPPEWLEEHMAYPFPELDLFESLGPQWHVDCFGNESLRFHNWLNHRERTGPWNRIFQTGLRAVPTLIESCLRHFDRAPYYRQICVVERP